VDVWMVDVLDSVGIEDDNESVRKEGQNFLMRFGRVLRLMIV
jgi:hypothetical protein